MIAPILAACSVICLFLRLSFVRPAIMENSREIAQGTSVAPNKSQNRTEIGAVLFYKSLKHDSLQFSNESYCIMLDRLSKGLWEL